MTISHQTEARPRVAVAHVVREKFAWALPSLRRLYSHGGAPFALYLVDCGYPIEIRREIDALVADKPWVTVIDAPRYLLPNESLNLVIERAEEEFLCLVQNDVLVEPNFFPELLGTFDRWGCDLVWPETFEVKEGRREPHRDEYTDCAMYDEGGVMKVQVKRDPAEVSREVERPIQHFEMHCLMFKKEAARALAPFPVLNSREHIDCAVHAFRLGLKTYVNERARANYVLPPIWDFDAEYFAFRWDRELADQSHQEVMNRWNIDPMPTSMGFIIEHGQHARRDLRKASKRVTSEPDIDLPPVQESSAKDDASAPMVHPAPLPPPPPPVENTARESFLKEVIQEQLREQTRWRARSPRLQNLAEDLVRREFASNQDSDRILQKGLREFLDFATSRVSFYRERPSWLKGGKRASAAVELLQDLPILKKADVQQHFEALRGPALPEHLRGNLVVQSSGTTGRPTKVVHNAERYAMSFALYSQRHMRWEGVDPAWKNAVIRRPGEIGRSSDGKELAAGEIRRERAWPNLGQAFETGPAFSISRATPLEEQIEMLRTELPEILVTYPSALESMVFATQGKPAPSLRALRTISATLTPGMRARIESATLLPIFQNYGLNELGLVASRCPKGRYHVNSESFLVEIVDDDGAPTPPGQTGHLLITGFTNFAMPLLRYDSGDLAQVEEGPCPCGRTLPSFGMIVGRYRAMQHTPAGTGQRVNRLMGTVEAMPLERLRAVREYQLHQYRDGSFELRVAADGLLDQAFIDSINAVWTGAGPGEPPLLIKQVDKIPTPPGGKQQEFSSDFFPPIDEAVSP